LAIADFKKHILDILTKTFSSKAPKFVIPAKAGIQDLAEKPLDSGSSPE
jgi:hypothetical protein